MALQGTLDTFSLPDVLRLLATTGKTGCLHLDGDRGRGRVWMDDGSLVAATADRTHEGASIDEVVFEMLRFDNGSFRFAVDEQPPGGRTPTDVEAAMQRAGRLLDEWRSLESVVPSLDHHVQMAPELTVDQVTIDGSRWEALVAIAGGRSVGDLGKSLGEGELGITRIVSDLVELGIAVVEAPSASTSRRSSLSERRNVTDIGSRGGDADTNGRRAPSLPARDRELSGDDGSRAWSPAAEADTAPTRRYRDTGGTSRRNSSNASLDTAPTPRASTAKPTSPSANGNGSANRTPSGNGSGSTTRSPSSRRVGTVTPPGGTRPADGANGRTREIGSARSSRARASRPPSPTTPANGHQVPLPQTRNGHALAPAPAPLPPRDPSNETPLRRLQPLPSEPTSLGSSALDDSRLPIPERGPAGPLLPPSEETRGPIFPPSLETRIPPLQPLDAGHLGPSPLPNNTGQIPTLAASALPEDLTWAAEDQDDPIGPPTAANSVFAQPSPLSPPSSPLSTPPPPPASPVPPPPPATGAAPMVRRPASAMPPSRPMPNGRGDNGSRPMPNGRGDNNDPAPHVVAMSTEARAAVEATVGRAGGGYGSLALAGASQEQLLNRGQLLRFLASVR